MTPSKTSVRLNIPRGIMSIVEQVGARIPHGTEILNQGLRDVIHRGIQQNSSIPKEEITAVELAEQLGFLEKPRGRRRK